GSEGLCTEGFIDGLNTAAALFDAAAHVPQPPPPGGGEEPPAGNIPPTMTDIGALGTIGQGETLALSFNDLLVGSNARDIDGYVAGFIVQEVSSGSLTIGGSPFDAASNNFIARQNGAVWTATAGALGNVVALRLLAVDEQGAVSNVSVPARITVTSGFNEGSGTLSDPWVIETPTQLNLIRHNLSAYFILGGNIDLGGSSASGPFYNGGAGWEPIGTPADPFTGGLEGDDFQISNLYINRPGSDYVGMFGYVSEAAGWVHNVDLQGVDITGRDYTGGVAGYHGSDGYLLATVVGEVTGRHKVGGLVGGGSPYIANWHSNADATGEDYVGGIVGWLIGGGIAAYSTHSDSVVQGENYVGGAVGYAENSELNYVTLWGQVNGSNHVGGAVGYLLDSTLI